jgi:hypothetical protein
MAITPNLHRVTIALPGCRIGPAMSNQRQTDLRNRRNKAAATTELTTIAVLIAATRRSYRTCWPEQKKSKCSKKPRGRRRERLQRTRPKSMQRRMRTDSDAAKNDTATPRRLSFTKSTRNSLVTDAINPAMTTPVALGTTTHSIRSAIQTSHIVGQFLKRYRGCNAGSLESPRPSEQIGHNTESLRPTMGDPLARRPH